MSRSNRVLQIMVILLALVFVYIQFEPLFKSKSESKIIKRKQKNVQKISDPIFKKEGDLWLMNSDGDTIQKLDIEIADKGYDRAKGLMDRSSMKENRGMLFVFPEADKQSFWMKNTIIPLDILYITDEFTVESIQENTKPFDENSYPSKGLAKYVLEVNAGFCATHNIHVESKIAFSYN